MVCKCFAVSRVAKFAKFLDIPKTNIFTTVTILTNLTVNGNGISINKKFATSVKIYRDRREVSVHYIILYVCMCRCVKVKYSL